MTPITEPASAHNNRCTTRNNQEELIISTTVKRNTSENNLVMKFNTTQKITTQLTSYGKSKKVACIRAAEQTLSKRKSTHRNWFDESAEAIYY